MVSWLPRERMSTPSFCSSLREVFVELAVRARSRSRLSSKVENDVRHVRSPGGRRSSAQSWRSNVSPHLAGPGIVTADYGEQAVRGRLFVIRTSTMSPISPAFSSTITGCSQGERPTCWPGSRPGFSISSSTSRPTSATVEVALLFRKQRLQPLQPLVLDRFGNLAVHVGAGRARAAANI